MSAQEFFAGGSKDHGRPASESTGGPQKVPGTICVSEGRNSVAGERFFTRTYRTPASEKFPHGREVKITTIMQMEFGGCAAQPERG